MAVLITYSLQNGIILLVIAFLISSYGLPVIPGNDDAIRAVKLIAGAMADAVLEGRQGEQTEEPAEESAEA